MFFKYLMRELTKRRKQTVLISSGLAIAIALVVVVNSVSTGIKTAQSTALSGLYGIGTDISVSKVADFSAGPPKFDIASGDGTTNDSKRTFSKSRLEINRASGTLSQTEIDAVSSVAGVTNSVATLKLTSVTFNGELPNFVLDQNEPAQTGQPGQPQANASSKPVLPTGGSDGAGGSSFDVTSFSVEGIGVSSAALGPLAAVEVAEGRVFTSADAKAKVAVIDSSYAASEKIALGDTIKLADTKFKVVGLVTSSSTGATTPSNVYIPIALAQSLSDNADVYSNVYVAADSSKNLATIKVAIEKVAPKTTVSTSADLASTVTGTLSTASSLVNNLGNWLSIIVLLAAFATSILFTTSGVNRRIREFGTLKAIGWRSRRIVGQVVGESLVNGLLGGLLGIGIGFAGVWAVNSFAPSLTASVASATANLQGGPGGMGGPGGPGAEQAAPMDLVLHSSVDFQVIAIAIGFAILGGLLAGAFGGLRAARLSPANALRSLE